MSSHCEGELQASSCDADRNSGRNGMQGQYLERKWEIQGETDVTIIDMMFSTELKEMT